MVTSNLRELVQPYGITLSDLQLAHFDLYARMLEDWSHRANLVGDASRDVVERRHFVESVAFGAALRERELLRPDSTVIDIGAGAGFPGLVLKIVWPGIALTLLEATAKKTAFLTALVEALELLDVAVATGRAEDLAHQPELRGRFDLVVARAVAPLPVLLELTLPFARVRGRVAAVKGSRGGDELGASTRALEILGGGTALAMPFRVPGPEQQIVVVPKQQETPAEYPRRAGVPKRQPL